MYVVEEFVKSSICICKSKPDQSVIFFLTLVEMNVILNVRVSIHFQDVTCLHLSSFLKGMATGKKLASVLFSKLARA